MKRNLSLLCTTLFLLTPHVFAATPAECLPSLQAIGTLPLDLEFEFPDDFKILNKHLTIPTGRVPNITLETADQISKSFAEDESLVLTTSLFGFGTIPGVNGVLFKNRQPVSNVFLRTLDLTGVKNYADDIKAAKHKAQGNIRSLFNLEAFANVYHASVAEDGYIVVPKGAKDRQQKEITLNRIANFLGLEKHGQRKVIVAIRIISSDIEQILFDLHTRDDGRIGLRLQGQKNKSYLNISTLIQNLNDDREIGGFILTSSNQSIYITPRGYEVRNLKNE